MVRLLKTPEQIREIVRARIDRIPEIREYAARIDVPSGAAKSVPRCIRL